MNPWTSHQLADSAFPTGGFAHSSGLEAAVQMGRVAGAAGLFAFVEECLWQASSFSLPFLLEAHRHPSALAAVDRRCDAATPGQVANRASRAQGRAFLRAAAALGPEVAELAREAARAELPRHLAPVSGAALARLGASPREACDLFLFQAARGVLSAGIRLGLVGPLEGQELLAAAGATAALAAEAASGRSLEEAASSSPLLDLLQSHQDRLYSRLFQS